MGERSAGNPHAAFDVEGAGNVARHRPIPARQSSTLPMRGIWNRSYGRATKAPPDERGGNRHAWPTATAPHPDSTHGGPSLWLPRRSARGHGLPAPSTARRVRSGIRERTVAEIRSNREDALMPAIPGHVTMQTKNMHDDVFRHHGIAAGRLDLEERCIWQLWMVGRGSTQAERL